MAKFYILEKNRVYNLSCGKCGAAYVGQTGRKLSTRFIEHFRSFAHRKEGSNFTKHVIQSGHPFSIENK